MLYNLELFGINTVSLKENSIFKDINERKKYHQKTGEEKYQFLKELQGELHVFYLKLRTKLQDNKQVELNQMISAVRSSMHAVKSVKDIGTNILDLKNSSKDIKYNFFLHHKKEIENLYLQLNAILLQDKKTNFEELQNIFNTIQSNYSSALYNLPPHACQPPGDPDLEPVERGRIHASHQLIQELQICAHLMRSCTNFLMLSLLLLSASRPAWAFLPLREDGLVGSGCLKESSNSCRAA